MNKTVEFSTAKLLKEKGFDKKVNIKYAFCDGGDIDEFKLVSSNDYEDFNLEYLERRKFINKNGVDELEEFSAPIIADVVMWLYEKYGIWISVDVAINGRFRYIIRKYNNNDRAWEVKNLISISEYYNSPTEAYESGIEYTLKNLI